jgi:hypothetical protein
MFKKLTIYINRSKLIFKANLTIKVKNHKFKLINNHKINNNYSRHNFNNNHNNY